MGELSSEQLSRVAHDLERLRNYFACNASAESVPAGGSDPLSSVHRELSSLVRWAEDAAPGVQATESGEAAGAENVPGLDARRLQAFADYLTRLRGTLIKKDGVDPDGSDLVGLIAGYAQAADRAVVALLDRAGVAVEEALNDRAQSMASLESGPPPEPELSLEEERDLPNEPMTFQESFDEPLLCRDGENAVLGRRATELLDRFCELNELDLNPVARHDLERKVVRWIEGMPDRQLLVLKMGWPDGKRAPYPSYRVDPDQVEDHESAWTRLERKGRV